MPNYVTNVLTLKGKQEDIDRLVEFVKNEEENMAFDFNKIIPMPESLNITEGRITDDGMSLYLTLVNPETEDFGFEKMDADDFTWLLASMNYEMMYFFADVNMSKEDIEGLEKEEFEKRLEIGRTAISNFQKYGATTWYHWCIDNWGTKWNAGGDNTFENNMFCFTTAWSCPMPIFTKLSQMFADVEMNIKWADEDIGQNCGEVVMRDGRVIRDDSPEEGTEKAVEFALDVFGVV